MKIAVTGANGFIGSHVVRQLAKAGHVVVPVVRPGADTRFLNPRHGRPVFCGMRSTADFREPFAGVDCVVHVAALARDWGPLADFEEANIHLAERAVRAALEQGVRHFIHISTNAVLGEEDCRVPKPEDAPYNPRLPYLGEGLLPSAMNHYRVTKAEGEKRVMALARKESLDLTVIRPVWVFGPREFHSGPFEYCTTTRDLPAFPGCDGNLFHAVYVGDVARMVEMVATRRPQGVQVYHCGSPKVLPMTQFFGLFSKAMGRSAPVRLPQWLLYLPVVVMELAAKAMGAKNPPPLTRARLYMFYANNVYDVGRAERELGFRADTDLDRAIRQTVRWWKLNRFFK